MSVITPRDRGLSHGEIGSFFLRMLLSYLGEFGEPSGTLLAAVTHWNYKTISHGADSLVGRLIGNNGSKIKTQFCIRSSDTIHGEGRIEGKT